MLSLGENAAMNILLIDDDDSIASSLNIILKHADLEADRADTGRDGLFLAIRNHYDLIILDLGLPDLSGHEVLQELRSMQIDTPVLILTGLDDTASMVQCFGAGADDDLTKPFDCRELIARIHAIVRRSKRQPERIIRTGKIAVNLDARTVEVDGKTVHLTGYEYKVLELLSIRKGATLTKRNFLDHLHAGIDVPAVKTIDVFVCKLRRKLALVTGGESCIDTIRGTGYRLRDPLVQGADPDDSEPQSSSPNSHAHSILAASQSGRGNPPSKKVFVTSNGNINTDRQCGQIARKAKAEETTSIAAYL